MTLEVRIPISPRPAWINRVKLITRSIKRWYPDLQVTVSCYPYSEDALAILGLGVTAQVRWVQAKDSDRWANTRSEYLATMMDRYKPPFHGDHILMLDADVIPVARFDELFKVNAIQGVQAHHSPYGADGWRVLFRDFGLPSPQMTHQYSGWGTMEHRSEERYGPFYPNSGVVFGPRHLFEELVEPFADAIEFLRANVQDTYWFDQVGFALGCGAANISTAALPLRFNFPNRPMFDDAHWAELDDVRFLHAMQTDVVHRDRDFEDDAAMAALVARRDLTGSNEVLRHGVEELMEHV